MPASQPLRGASCVSAEKRGGGGLPFGPFDGPVLDNYGFQKQCSLIRASFPRSQER